jgi:DNA polymerase
MTPREAVEAIDLVYGRPIHAIASSLRGLIVAPDGKILRAGDFAAIEARGAAWLTGEDWLLKAFREGRDLYKEMASIIFDVPVLDVDSRQRFVGKTTVLGCGYGMGPDKFLVSCVVLDPNTDVTASLADKAVSTYRETNTRIIAGWYALQRASVRAILNPGTPQQACRVSYTYTPSSGVLRCTLPSGRSIYYWGARVEDDGRGGVMSYQRDPEESADKTEDEQEADEVAGEEGDKPTGRRTMWGGALLENVTQAMCRDLLRDALLRVRREGAPIILHAHDEIVLEVNADDTMFTCKWLETCMALVPEWATGMPIKVEAWENRRFRK